MAAFQKTPPQKVIVYRGMHVKSIAEFKREYTYGRLWASFSSTSSTLFLSKSFIKNKTEGVVFKINAQRGYNVGIFSQIPSEKEILVLPNSNLVVTKALYIDTEGYARIQLLQMRESTLLS